MKYGELLDYVLSVHFDAQPIQTDERDIYLRFLLNVVEELYNLLAPLCSWSYFKRTETVQNNVVQSIIIPRGYLKILKIFVADITDVYGKGEYKEINRVEMEQLRNKLLSPGKSILPCRVYASNMSITISTFNNVDATGKEYNIIYIPNIKQPPSIINFQEDLLDESVSSSEYAQYINASKEQQEIEDMEIPLPSTYNSLIINGLLLWLYRTVPSIQGSSKEALALQLWNKGKEEAVNAAIWKQQLYEQAPKW